MELFIIQWKAAMLSSHARRFTLISGSSLRQRETGKPNQINMPIFFLVSCQLIFEIIHLRDRSLPNYSIDGSAGSNPVYFFLSFLSTCWKLVTFRHPGLNHNWRNRSIGALFIILVAENIRQCIRSWCHDRTQLRGPRRAKRTNGNYAKRLLSRHKAMAEESLCQPLIVDAFPVVSSASCDPLRSFAATKDTILRKVIGADAHKESHKVEGYLQEDMR